MVDVRNDTDAGFTPATVGEIALMEHGAQTLQVVEFIEVDDHGGWREVALLSNGYVLRHGCPISPSKIHPCQYRFFLLRHPSRNLNAAAAKEARTFFRQFLGEGKN